MRVVLASSIALLACGARFDSSPAAAGGGAGAGTTSGSGGLGGAGAATSSPSSSSGGAGGSAFVPPCHPGISDGFDGAELDDTLWNKQGKVDQITVSDSSLHLTPEDSGVNQWMGLVSKDRFDVTGCAVWIHVEQLINGSSGAAFYFNLYHADGSVGFTAAEGQLELRFPDVPEVVVPYDESAHAWWRLREEGGQVQMETAPDGESWTILHSDDAPAHINDMAIGLGTTPVDNLASPSPYEVRLDSLNLPP